MLPLLLRRGLRAVSVAPTFVAATKAAIAAVDLTVGAPMNDRAAGRATKTDAVGAYKHILSSVLDRRPSGTRQRLAAALGKNRSFVSQITNPAYPVPVPAQHLSVIFEICHFSPAERQAFLDAYHAAHPRRLVTVAHGPATRRIAVDVPDLGDGEAKPRARRPDRRDGPAPRADRPRHVTGGTMKKFVNAVDTVLSESLDGFAAAHADIVALGEERKFVRRRILTPGKVALISGGGSGHEPLHAGFVGMGMLDAACPGQVFTSPTPDQMLAAAEAVDTGAGLPLHRQELRRRRDELRDGRRDGGPRDRDGRHR